jgi:hypothetical protein
LSEIARKNRAGILYVEMSQTIFENGASYYVITRKIEQFVDRHGLLDTKQEKEINLLEMLLFTMDYPDYMNHYDSLREVMLENVRKNYIEFGCDPDFLSACENWIDMFGDTLC